jgi:hypothetical protein
VIIEKMRDRFRQFLSILDDEPAFDPSVALFRDGLTVNQVVSRLAPQLGGPVLVVAQNEVEHQLRRGIDKQTHVIHEQAEVIEELREYARRLEHEIISLRRVLAQRAAAE